MFEFFSELLKLEAKGLKLQEMNPEEFEALNKEPHNVLDKVEHTKGLPGKVGVMDFFPYYIGGFFGYDEVVVLWSQEHSYFFLKVHAIRKRMRLHKVLAKDFFV